MEAEKEDAVVEVAALPSAPSLPAAADEPLEALPPPPKKLLKGVDDMKLEAVVEVLVSAAVVVAAPAAEEEEGAVDTFGLMAVLVAAADELAVFLAAVLDWDALTAATLDDIDAVGFTLECREAVVVEGGGKVEEAERSDFPAPAVALEAGAAKPGSLEVEKMFLDILDMVCMSEGCSVTASAAVVDGGAVRRAYS